MAKKQNLLSEKVTQLQKKLADLEKEISDKMVIIDLITSSIENDRRFSEGGDFKNLSNSFIILKNKLTYIEDKLITFEERIPQEIISEIMEFAAFQKNFEDFKSEVDKALGDIENQLLNYSFSLESLSDKFAHNRSSLDSLSKRIDDYDSNLYQLRKYLKGLKQQLSELENLNYTYTHKVDLYEKKFSKLLECEQAGELLEAKITPDKSTPRLSLLAFPVLIFTSIKEDLDQWSKGTLTSPIFHLKLLGFILIYLRHQFSQLQALNQDLHFFLRKIAKIRILYLEIDRDIYYQTYLHDAHKMLQSRSKVFIMFLYLLTLGNILAVGLTWKFYLHIREQSQDQLKTELPFNLENEN